MKTNTKIVIVIIFLITVGIGYYLYESTKPRRVGEIHIHADFKVYINGEAMNFSQEKYMSNEKRLLSNFAHLHDLEGDVMHFHLRGVDLGFFFKTLNITFTHDCFDGYCNEGSKTLKLYVNGKLNSKMQDYIPKDLDKILITYGDDTDLAQQIASVTDKACIQSLKCPEKGTPGNESSCSSAGNCIAEDLP